MDIDGRKIYKKRIAVGMTRKELAEKVHISIRVLKSWELGQRECSNFEIANEIAGILSCSLKDLCTDLVMQHPIWNKTSGHKPQTEGE